MRKLILLMSLAATPSLPAHDDPHDVIHDLTHQIEKGENLQELYMKRAMEHRSVGHLKATQSDLIKVTQLNSDHFYAWLALGKLQADKGSALLYLENAKEVTANEEQKALVNIAYADHYYLNSSEDNDLLALKYAGEALGNRGETYQDTELVLLKAHLLHCVGRLDERAKFLAEVMQKNVSVVIRNKQIDARIAKGDTEGLIPLIRSEIENSRFTSSWKIRLAQCELARNPAGSDAASQLLNEAILEINKRYNPANPDSTLLMDRALANYLLGDLGGARDDLKLAQTMTHDHYLLREIESVMTAKK